MPRLLVPVLLFPVLLFPACGGGGGGGVVRGTASVQATADVLSGTTATLFTFYGQASDVDAGVVSYAWDFDEDGTDDATTQTATFTFATEGTKTVRLAANGPDGNVNVAILRVNVMGGAMPPTEPAVALRVRSLHGTAPSEVFCEVEAVDPDGGAIVEYAFDFNDDGTADVTTASPTASFTLPETGRFPVRVTVTDDQMESSEASAFLVLCDGPAYPDHAPSCQISVPSGAASTDTTTPLDLVAAGTDIDGGAVFAIEWDLDDDGVFGDMSGRVISPVFADPGVHRVRVRLTDDEMGPPSEAEIRILVTDAPVDLPPSAWASAEALVVAPAQAVQFHGHGTDAEDQALTFSWDFDGDGVADAAVPHPTFAFVLPGVYRPRLTVTDFDGNTSHADLTVLVEACPEVALASFRYGPQSIALLRDTVGQITLMPASLPASQLRFRLVHKLGDADDAGATAIDVADETMASLPMATSLIDAGVDGSITIDIASLVPGGDGERDLYTVGVRIEDPGVRVQVMSFDVLVVDAIQASLFVVDNHPLFEDEYYAALQLIMNADGVPGLTEIYEIELVFADMTPPWLEVIPGGMALLPFGWSEDLTATTLRFSTVTNPVPTTGSGPTFQFRFDTDTAGVGLGPVPTAGTARLYDVGGNLIVTVPLDISGL